MVTHNPNMDGPDHSKNTAHTGAAQGSLPNSDARAASPSKEERTIFLKLASQDGAMFNGDDEFATDRGRELFQASRGLKAEETRVLTLRPDTEIVILSGKNRSEPLAATQVSIKTSGFLPWVGQIKLKDGCVISDLSNAPGLKKETPAPTVEGESANSGGGVLSALSTFFSRKKS